MLNRKEKDVKKHLIEDNFEFSNQDKEDILNSIKSKINLEVEEKPSFKERFNLKVVYALVCSLVICILGFVGYKHIIENRFIDPNYRGKDVESLNLEEGEYCLAYTRYLDKIQFFHLKNEYEIMEDYSNSSQAYIISNDNQISLFISKYNLIINLCLEFSSLKIIEKYNLEYNTTFNETNLNNDNSGLLFGVKENGIEFYTIKNGINYSIFVEFA